MSKKSLIVAAYNALVAAGPLPARKDVIANLASAADVSAACASTYLSNIVSGKWATDGSDVKPAKAAKPKKVKVAKTAAEAAPGLTIDAVTAMSNKDLVAAYNAKSDKPVTKFRDHATGVKRTLAVYGLAGA